MEFLLVCKTKLKIVLDKEEAAHYRLSDFPTEGAVELRKRLSEILKKAEERVGFSTEGKRLLVSYYPTRLAGAELFVTVVGVPESRPRYYIFPSLDELSRACAAADGRVDGSLYLLSGGEYCLAVSTAELECDIFSEFADEEAEGSIAPLLKHSRLIKKADAVSTLASLWCGGCSP